jgi:hypothetical protein
MFDKCFINVGDVLPCADMMMESALADWPTCLRSLGWDT